MSAFTDTVATFVDAFFALHPTSATAIGDHRYDDRWPDVSESGRSTRLAFLDHWTVSFTGLDPANLTPDEAIDRDLLLLELDSQRFDELTLQDDRWDPLSWVYLIGDGLFSLLSRGFAPLPDRLASVAGRLEGLPELLDGARTSLVGASDGRPVGRFQTETALQRLAGIDALIDEALAAAEDAGPPDDPDLVDLRSRLSTAATTGRTALAAFETHLRDTVLPTSDGDGRLGRALFDAKIRHTMRSDALSAAAILEAAEREFPVVRAEMARLARELWSAWCTGMPEPDDDGAAIRSVLDAIAAEHPAADELLDVCRDENARIEAFCRDRDVIGLADEPMDIRWTPVFLRSFGGAMLISPGPLERELPAFFAITPMPDDWTDAQRESYLREDDLRMLRLLTIHEAVPGHYLQGVYANRSSSLPRTIFSSGLFAEGWAVYVTQVMMDLGYGADDPALLLTHWKFYLRSITNAIIDARIHTSGMTQDEAVSFMVDGGFQETSEARAKYDRARLSSTQLSTYFAGSMEMWAIELDARRRAAEGAGADPSAIEAHPLPGGLGETPGFRYRDHLEAVISHGSPPTSLLRRCLAS
jgi:uncharacterized protein (DUF885 family)